MARIITQSCILILDWSDIMLLLVSVSVYADGSICLDILQNRWSPTYDVAAILTSIQVRVIGPYGGVSHIEEFGCI